MTIHQESIKESIEEREGVVGGTVGSSTREGVQVPLRGTAADRRSAVGGTVGSSTMGILSYIIRLNGVYDILCAFSILGWVPIPYLNKLHLSMIKNRSPIFDRFVAYWIFTYGVIRLSNDSVLISMSYLIEGLFFANEYRLGTVYEGKTLFVIISSLLLAYFSLYYI